jgi:hypothetical protein
MCFVAGNDRKDKRGHERVGCKPPKAVSTFHAKKILGLVVMEAFNLRRENAQGFNGCEARTS